MNAALDAFVPLAAIVQDEVSTAAALFTRLSLLLIMLPGIGGSSVPIRVRLTLALALCAALFPLTTSVQPGSLSGLFALVGGEAFVGFALGFSVRVLVLALNVTGAIVAQSLSLSQVFGVTQDGDSSSLLSTMLTISATALFVSAGLHVDAVALLVRNIEALPVGMASEFAAAPAAEAALEASGAALSLGVRLALPFMVLNFTYYLVLGFLNRAMPQLMVTFVGIPAITLGGLVLLTAAVGALLTVWLTQMAEVIAG